MSIQIKGVSKTFGSFEALKNINLDIQTGELVALLGPSGSGKTSLLRIIAGLEEADDGVIFFGNEEITHIRTTERKVGFVFQHYALFKHMTVFDNVAYGLRVRSKKERPSKKDIKKKVTELLSLVKLEAFADRYPAQLSGGQRQRVALARALAVEPKVLLLDEPFGALDAKVRKELRRWLRRLHDEFHITSIFVTHDQEEALDVADRIVVMNEGRIEQIGSPEEVYEQPNSPFVYDFLGNVNIFHGRLEDGQWRNGNQADAEQQALAYVRPHDIVIEREKPTEDAVEAKVIHVHAVGRTVHIELKEEEADRFLEAELPKEQYRELDIQTGETVFVRPNQLKVFVPADFSI
ncbi:sulfate/molybdate ABC transporter ATP-binding protein [Domibacillus sp. DTU_2020_1001157_1_SI_ALB_TIR_016]|uniref:sulfate/molybdate ABC transporter ATP-binding protein n=1 Tax=Domibacillus sp. DTU_2020_1001157_1_SI_ALB_TIR_016 TaxID=3077789 RepID=UPI0028F14855|nr:sulfate/molybdate ABC transporter ATP-binding protein [Domibacillus sp. DTU_2020_1001157_1_SI_ALB_TIR_016]WNS78334.1 sulfate/molybdate ABC transporter ATP-binding protein [Domibacillus sp. DTU_2020_1001157_1_SI_ALB_TIR_016]